ncbi:MAG TPA: dTDP-4-dehydrorhamnose 3,5-epimerase [Planctomycetota bacterium]|nr:dTDP-4-dehydrorhamnose 3,5-epimerase [Planctomycetota bacterium]
MADASQPWLIPGAIRDPQSVTPHWDRLVDLIPGVKIQEIKRVSTAYGFLEELWRKDWGFGDADQVFQTTLMSGRISAWHSHGKTFDRLYVASGIVQIVLYDYVRRLVNELVYGDHRPALVVIPPGIWHGTRNVGPGPARVINVVDRAYSYTEPDHWRLPADTDQIPFDGFRRALLQKPPPGP